jgi:two-component sensor histidine kinase
MQHRVKNNFQTIISLIQVRKQSLPGSQGRELAEKVTNAIIAMSMAHEQLSPTRTGEVVALNVYLQALVTSFAVTADAISIEVVSDDIDVSIEQAVPIGLIMNELLTNSIKHAFGPKGGSIRVDLHASAQGLARLIVSDNGKGLGSHAGAGSGLRLIRSLADQLRGEIVQNSSSAGVTTTLSFVARPR